MKQLIKDIDNSEILEQGDYRDFFLNVKTSDILENELRIAVQSYKLAMNIIDSHVGKIVREKQKNS